MPQPFRPPYPFVGDRVVVESQVYTSVFSASGIAAHRDGEYVGLLGRVIAIDVDGDRRVEFYLGGGEEWFHPDAILRVSALDEIARDREIDDHLERISSREARAADVPPPTPVEVRFYVNGVDVTAYPRWSAVRINLEESRR